MSAAIYEYSNRVVVKVTNITPVLLAGGSGTRLWPFSRKSYPKQFSNILGKQTLFQQSVLRLISSECVEFTSQITLTNSEYRFIVAEQLQKLGWIQGIFSLSQKQRILHLQSWLRVICFF